MITLRAAVINTIRTGFLSLSVAMMTLGLPLVTFADEAATTCTAPAAAEPGNRVPSGAAGTTYTYNCDSKIWENEHYTYNPDAQIYTPKAAVIYTYNASTGKYDYGTWEYNAAQGKYYLLAASTATPPAGAQIIGEPESVVPMSQANLPPGSPTASGSNSTTSGTATGATNNSGTTTSSNSQNATKASLSNVLTSVANSGSAGVISNLTAGSATSGDAQGIANIVNLLQSSSNALGDGNLVTFVSNIDGDVNGDLLLDPAMLSTLQPASGNTNIDNSTTFNNSVDASINNNITLAAASGNADVKNNTAAGNATTGNATAVANLVNTINSVITSGKSFLGVVNINGNLNGDILLPPDFIDQLLAANVPTITLTAPNSLSSGTTTINDNTTITNTNNSGITNNIDSSAASGQATVSGNTNAGSATSGSAGTSITAFNLTGSSVIGSNNLLVFVNVLGKWVGLIVNAPAGATAAQLGGGVTSNMTINNNSTVNNDVKQQINNNIDISARSGDATVSGNTTAGAAKTGDAKTAVNLLNIQDSSLAFSNWFGILFINVFGTWNGSFGVNTSAGDPITLPRPGTFGSAPDPAQAFGAVQVFRFVPKAPTQSATTQRTQPSTATIAPAVASSLPPAARSASVLTANTQKAATAASTTQSRQNSIWRTASILAAVVTLYIVSESLLSAYRQRRQA